MFKIEPFIDISNKITVNNNSYSGNQYSVKAPNNRYLILSQISLAVDSNFISNGKFQVSLNGKVITSNDSTSGELEVLNYMNIDFKERDFVFIEPNSSVNVQARVTSGSGVIQPMVTGMILTKEEFELLRKKYLGVA